MTYCKVLEEKMGNNKNKEMQPHKYYPRKLEGSILKSNSSYRDREKQSNVNLVSLGCLDAKWEENKC